MLEKLNAVQSRYDELNHLLEENAQDYQRVAELAKERSDLEPIITRLGEYREVMKRIEEARALQGTEDEELRQLALSDLEEYTPKADKLEKELKT